MSAKKFSLGFGCVLLLMTMALLAGLRNQSSAGKQWVDTVRERADEIAPRLPSKPIGRYAICPLGDGHTIAVLDTREGFVVHMDSSSTAMQEASAHMEARCLLALNTLLSFSANQSDSLRTIEYIAREIARTK